MHDTARDLLIEEFRDIVTAVIGSKSFLLVFATFGASAYGAAIEIENLWAALEGPWIFYTGALILTLLGSLLFRFYAKWLYRRLKLHTPHRVKILPWMIVSWPSYAAWMFLMGLGATALGRVFMVAQEFVMLSAFLTVLVTEAYQLGLYWFGREDSLWVFLRRFGRGLKAGLAISQGDYDRALGVFIGGRENTATPTTPPRSEDTAAGPPSDS